MIGLDLTDVASLREVMCVLWKMDVTMIPFVGRGENNMWACSQFMVGWRPRVKVFSSAVGLYCMNEIITCRGDVQTISMVGIVLHVDSIMPELVGVYE